MTNDRHLNDRYTYRPSPANLLIRLDAVRGARTRAAVISDLLARYLDGKPMPRRPWLAPKRHKSDSTTDGGDLDGRKARVL
jgi:hypothetical protein